jgi:AbrB family looped-hinge helix DNA binding protein
MVAWSTHVAYRSEQMAKAIISPEGQISIPKGMRERLNLTAGTQVSLDLHGDALILRRASENSPDWRTMRGMFRDASALLQDLADERASELTRDDARISGVTYLAARPY